MVDDLRENNLLMGDADVIFIRENDQLARACKELSVNGVVAVDTEFQRETTYYPKPALVQLCATDQVFLIDCLSIDDWQPLAKLLLEDSVIKLLHSGSEDMEVFYRLTQTIPRRLIDTQVAASIAGYGFSRGYQVLVSELLGIELDKEQTRSNWLQRPLTPAQLQYAANDVLWLPALWEKLQSSLEAKGRLVWCEQDCERLLSEPVPSRAPVELAYLKLKSAWQLQGVSLHALRELCAWREKAAQTIDIPKARIFSDACAMEIARRVPDTKKLLLKIAQERGAIRQDCVNEVFDLLLSVRSSTSAEWPQSIRDKSEPNYRRKLKQLRAVVEQFAEELDLPPEVLGRKRELEKAIDSPESSEIMRGWRADLMAEKVSEILAAA